MPLILPINNFNHLYENEYSDWFVIQVKKGRETIIKQKMDAILKNSIKLVLFSKELIHRKKGKPVKILYPLFPGYIFVKKCIDRVCQIAKYYFQNEFIKPISFSGRPSHVKPAEMYLLLNNCDNSGVFRLSNVILEKSDQVKIINGPLKNINGKIEFINKKKNKARVKINLFNQAISVSLGLDFIEKDSSDSS